MTNATTYETGATTHAANNLVLPVMNDGAVYETRKKIARAALRGASYNGQTMRALCEAEAQKQRKDGGKFKAADISEAARIVMHSTMRDQLENILHSWRDAAGDNKISAYRRGWFDRINGNTYFSVLLVIPQADGGNAHLTIPMEYGYGDQWKYESLRTLEALGFISIPCRANGDKDFGFLSSYENSGFIAWTDEGDGRKRDMYEGLHLRHVFG